MPESVTIERLLEIVAQRGATRRSITALAGPPGAGKSTTAARLVDGLNAREPGSAAILPMDGYHLDDRILVPRGLRPRKGAPETFDTGGFAAMLRRLKDNAEPEIAIPVFERDEELSRAAAAMIGQGVRHLVVEGNYLLLDRSPWRDFRPLFDTTVGIGADEALVRRRIAERWQHYELLPSEIETRIEDNDLPNARLVLEASAAPEFLLPGE